MKSNKKLLVIILSLFGLSVVISVLIGLIIFLFGYKFIAKPRQIAGHSMEPNVTDGQYYFVNLLSDYGNGDIVIYTSPKMPQYEFVGRIIASGNDTFKIIDGEIYLNNVLLQEDYLQVTATKPGTYLDEGEEYPVPKDNFIILGDNRDNSKDSRDLGYVPKENIIGKLGNCYKNC